MKEEYSNLQFLQCKHAGIVLTFENYSGEYLQEVKIHDVSIEDDKTILHVEGFNFKEKNYAEEELETMDKFISKFISLTVPVSIDNFRIRSKIIDFNGNLVNQDFQVDSISIEHGKYLIYSYAIQV